MYRNNTLRRTLFQYLLLGRRQSAVCTGCKCRTLTAADLPFPAHQGLIRSHGILPWPSCIHLIVVSLTTALVVLVNQADSGYLHAMNSLWVSSLYPAGFSTLAGNPLSFPADRYYVQRGGQLADSINSVVMGAFRLQNSSVDFIGHTPGLPPVRLALPGLPPRSFHTPQDFMQWSGVHLINSCNCTCEAGARGDAIGPGCQAPGKFWRDTTGTCGASQWLQGASHISAQLYLRAFNPRRVLVTSAACTDWSIGIVWNLQSPGTARVEISPDSKACHDFALTQAPASFLAVSLIMAVALYQVMLCGSGLRQWGVVRDLLIVQRLAQALPPSSVAALRQSLEHKTQPCDTQAQGPLTSSTLGLLLAARQLTPFPLPCSSTSKLVVDSAARSIPTYASTCYGAVLCCPSRVGGRSNGLPGTMARQLWSCGPGVWWASRCCRVCLCHTCQKAPNLDCNEVRKLFHVALPVVEFLLCRRRAAFKWPVLVLAASCRSCHKGPAAQAPSKCRWYWRESLLGGSTLYWNLYGKAPASAGTGSSRDRCP